MKTIAVTEHETKRIILSGDRYIRQNRVFGTVWKDIEETNEEWLAAKWIINFDMKVAADYPTIEEIRKAQND